MLKGVQEDMGKKHSRNRIYISRIQRQMFLLSFATAFAAAFTQTLAVLIDKVVVCTFYREAEVAAVSLAEPFFYLLEIPAAGLAAGIQTVFAKETGAGQIDKVNRQFCQIFFLSSVILIILTAVSFLAVPGMAVLFGARGATAVLKPFAVSYLYGLSFEIIPYVLFCILMPAVILDNGGRLVSIASVCGCITDIVLDLVSVRSGWGLFGIGLASSVSAFVYFGITMLHFLDRDRVIRLHFERIRPGELRDIFIFSVPKACLSLAEVLNSILFISLVSATGGVIGAFALSVYITVSYTIMIFTKGIAGAAGVMTGICCGEKNGEDLEGIGVLAHRYILVLSVCVVAAAAVCIRPLSAALSESDASAELLAYVLFCVMISIPFSNLVHTRISCMQAAGRAKKAQRTGIAAALVFPALTACLLAAPMGVRGVFLAFPLSPMLTLAAGRLLHRKRTKKVFLSESDYMETDCSFYPDPGDVIAYPVKTKEDCSLAAEQVGLFCRGHKLDERKGFLAGLCVEELTTNVIEHALTSRIYVRTADLRVVIDGEDVIIRVRDGGAAFNLKRFAENLPEEGDPESRAGIRILVNSAKSINYYRTFGMNTTIIRI